MCSNTVKLPVSRGFEAHLHSPAPDWTHFHMLWLGMSTQGFSRHRHKRHSSAGLELSESERSPVEPHTL